MHRIGTSHFKDIRSARRYYAWYDESHEDVAAKIKAGEISIGAPSTCEPDERIVLGGDGRYYIQVGE